MKMVRVKALKIRRIIFVDCQVILLVAILALLALVSACKPIGKPGDQQIEGAKTAVVAIRYTLFVPADATLLAERLKYGTNPEHMPGCVRAYILMAYQTQRDFRQILTEYREALKVTDWEPSPYHSHDQDDFDIFIMGTQNFFEISDHPLRQDILPVPTLTSSAERPFTIYYLQLSHYDPAIIGCSG
jgi:hypothetical protein